MKVETRDQHGNAVCPVCATPVEQAGQFDSPSCYQHFLIVVQDQPGIIEIDDELLDIWQMPWYGEDTAA